MSKTTALAACTILESTECTNELTVSIAKGRMLSSIAAKLTSALILDDCYIRVNYTYLVNTPTSKGDFHTKHLQPGKSFSIDRNANLEIQILVEVYPSETFTIIKK
jgi:hypothetical protein